VPCMTSSLFHLRSSFLSILDKSDLPLFVKALRYEEKTRHSNRGSKTMH